MILKTARSNNVEVQMSKDTVKRELETRTSGGKL